MARGVARTRQKGATVHSCQRERGGDVRTGGNKGH